MKEPTVCFHSMPIGYLANVNVKTHTFITPNLIHTGIHLCEQWQQNGGQHVPQQKVPANINNRPQIMVLEAFFIPILHAK